jgi:hypothetical protein
MCLVKPNYSGKVGFIIPHIAGCQQHTSSDLEQAQVTCICLQLQFGATISVVDQLWCCILESGSQL